MSKPKDGKRLISEILRFQFDDAVFPSRETSIWPFKSSERSDKKRYWTTYTTFPASIPLDVILRQF